MSVTKRKSDFFTSEEAATARQLLVQMVEDIRYNTAPSYAADSARYPNNLLPFIDKHMNYLYDHPMINPGQYVSNLRLITRLKT